MYCCSNLKINQVNVTYLVPRSAPIVPLVESLDSSLASTVPSAKLGTIVHTRLPSCSQTLASDRSATDHRISSSQTWRLLIRFGWLLSVPCQQAQPGQQELGRKKNKTKNNVPILELIYVRLAPRPPTHISRTIDGTVQADTERRTWQCPGLLENDLLFHRQNMETTDLSGKKPLNVFDNTKFRYSGPCSMV